MSKFEVGKTYGYVTNPGYNNSNYGFTIERKIGNYLLATCGGRDQDYHWHIFDLEGKHLGSGPNGTPNPRWNLVAPKKKLQYKVVKSDGTVSDWVEVIGNGSSSTFTATTVAGFVKIADNAPQYFADRFSLKNAIIKNT